jgi:hypothetical protein
MAAAKPRTASQSLALAQSWLQCWRRVLASRQGLTMNRAIVLIVCLAGAAGIAVYSHGQREAGDQAVVYTVPQRTEPAAKPPVGAPPKPIETPGDRVTLVRSLQFELKRVGCYGGEINGVWTTSSRMAMRSFTDHVNASLPIDTPDYVLLSLVKGHQAQACAPSAAPARTAKADAKSEDAGDGTDALTAAGAAAAAAAAAAVAAPKPDAKAAAADDRARRAATIPPQQGVSPGKGVQREGVTPGGGPVPPEGMQEPRPKRSKQAEKSAQPPKFVRDFLKSLGFK